MDYLPFLPHIMGGAPMQSRQKRRGGSGKATANQIVCPSCKVSLGKDSMCRNRMCGQFSKIVRGIRHS